MPLRRTRRSGPRHSYQDDQRGPRIQKVLAEAGIDSRRACEAMVTEGRVTVNGQTIDSLPAWVNPATDDIRVDGKRVKAVERQVYVMLFKPKGVITTNRDPEGRVRAIDIVQHPSGVRLYPVGRLDIDASGLLLLTNDGELANRLTHARFEVEKGYELVVSGVVTPEALPEMERALFGRPRADGKTPGKLSIVNREPKRTVLHMDVGHAANAQLRNTMGALGHPIKKIRRLRMGPLRLKGLQVGEWRDLTAGELRVLRAHAFATPQERARRAHA